MINVDGLILVSRRSDGNASKVTKEKVDPDSADQAKAAATENRSAAQPGRFEAMGRPPRLGRLRRSRSNPGYERPRQTVALFSLTLHDRTVAQARVEEKVA